MEVRLRAGETETNRTTVLFCSSVSSQTPEFRVDTARLPQSIHTSNKLEAGIEKKDGMIKTASCAHVTSVSLNMPTNSTWETNADRNFAVKCMIRPISVGRIISFNIFTRLVIRQPKHQHLDRWSAFLRRLLRGCRWSACAPRCGLACCPCSIPGIRIHGCLSKGPRVWGGEYIRRGETAVRGCDGDLRSTWCWLEGERKGPCSSVQKFKLNIPFCANNTGTRYIYVCTTQMKITMHTSYQCTTGSSRFHQHRHYNHREAKMLPD